MNATDQIGYIKANARAIEKLEDERAKINEEILSSDLGVKRKEINAKIKGLKNDCSSVTWHKGHKDDLQLSFPFESEDPEKFYQQVKRNKPKKKEKEDTKNNLSLAS